MRYAALLRGINVGGNKKVSMAELRDFTATLGLEDPRTLLQSGNLIFESTATATKLESMLEVETRKHVGVDTKYFVRTATEWWSAIDANPFPNQAKRDPSHLVVMFLRNTPTPSAVKALQAAIVGRETVRVVGRQAYLVYPNGIGESKLTVPLIEKVLGTSGTGRNWNTVGKIGALLAE